MSLTQLINATRRWGPMFSIQGHSYGFQGEAPEAAIPPEKELQRLEAGGATPKDLAAALMDLYQVHFAEFRGLSCGFRRREQLSPQDPRMGVWALTVFRDGWRVLDHLGTTPEGLLCYLLGRWPPREWLGDKDRLRIPPAFLHHVEPDKLTFGPKDDPLDLSWLGWRLACGLTITGPIPGLRLPQALACAGDVNIEHVAELVTIQGLNAPGRRLSLKACPDLESIELPESTALVVQGCPRITQIRGKVTGDISVEDCQELTNLDIVLPKDALPAPSIVVRRCSKLGSIGRASGVSRVCKDIVVEDCPNFRGFWPRLIVRRERRITGCPLVMESR